MPQTRIKSESVGMNNMQINEGEPHCLSLWPWCLDLWRRYQRRLVVADFPV